MSKVIQALEHSERRHQALGTPQPQRFATLSQPQTKSRQGLSVMLALLPPILVATVVTLQTYQTAKQDWLKNNVAKPQLATVPFEYKTRSAPDFGSLAVTYRNDDSDKQDGWLIQAQETSIASVQPVPEPVAKTPITNANSKDELLSGVDLSQLSPELAQRFSSAIKPTPNQQNLSQPDSKASNLTLQAERWYGKLPALNFQTHVFSSQPNKRWVKINGVEYKQGAQIGDELDLVEIKQQSCLIRFKGQWIEIPALYDWKG